MDRKLVFAIVIMLAFIALIIAYPFLRIGVSSIMSDAKSVSELPKGYIFLPKEDGSEEWDYGLRYMFWESQISFLKDGVSVYQTSLMNSDFIVKFEGDYYINEEIFLGIVKNVRSTE